MLKRFASSLIALLLMTAFAIAQPAVTAYNEGKKFEKEEKYANALASYKKAISLNPSYKEALYAAGWCANELEKYTEALDYLQKAKKLWPNEAKIYLESGYANQNLEKRDAALDDFDQCLSLQEDYALAYKYRGNLYYDESNYEKALENYEKYSQYDSDITSSEFYYRKGYCYNEFDKYDDAIASLKKAVELKSNYTSAYNELGYAYLKQENREDALKTFNKALDVDPKSAVAMNGIGDVYKDIDKNMDKAIEAYQRTLRTAPENKKANYQIGWCLNDKEKYNDAVVYLKKALTIDSKYVNAMTELGYSYYSLENYDDALNQFDKALSIRKSELSFYYAGLCYIGLKQKSNAERMYRELKDMKSDNADKLRKKIDALK